MGVGNSPNVDKEWEKFLENLGIAMILPNRNVTTVHLTLYAPISKKMFVTLGPRKTKSFLKKSLIEGLKNAMQHIDGGV